MLFICLYIPYIFRAEKGWGGRRVGNDKEGWNNNNKKYREKNSTADSSGGKNLL